MQHSKPGRSSRPQRRSFSPAFLRDHFPFTWGQDIIDGVVPSFVYSTRLSLGSSLGAALLCFLVFPSGSRCLLRLAHRSFTIKPRLPSASSLATFYSKR